MSASARRWLTWGVAGAAAGALLAVAVGWWLWPVRLAGTSPANLRRDFRDDYIVMVAAAFEADHSLDAARLRLSLLDETDPARAAVALVDRLSQAGGNPQDIERLERLIEALRSPASPDESFEEAE